MSLEPIQQFAQCLAEAKHVLVLMPQNPSGDAIGSAWAMAHALAKRGSLATVAFTDELKEAERFSFLPAPERVVDNIYGSQDFVLSFNTEHNPITNVRTERLANELQIFITPERGSIDPRDFSFIPAKFKFDLLIVLDSPDKESIGKIFEESPDIFYEIPIVNIDHHADNEKFGQINFVNITASSTAEATAEVLERLDPNAMDARVAECLLAGLMSATESFQRKNTTPKSLQLAARLMERGADQQRISRYLYKTQPLNLLKLWGRVMLRVAWEEDVKAVWSVATLEDFVQSRTTPDDIPFVLEKIRDNYSSGKIFLVAYDKLPLGSVVVLAFAEEQRAKEAVAAFGGTVRRNLAIIQFADRRAEEAVGATLGWLRQG